MADDSSHDVPDLDLPPPRAARPSASLTPNAAPAPAPTPSSSRTPSVRQMAAMDIGTDGDDFDMELERGGAMSAQAPAVSSRSSARMPAHSSGSMAAVRSGPASTSLPKSGLDVAYRRMDAVHAAAAQGPSVLQKVLAYTLPLVVAGATLAGAVKALHRHGGRSVIALLPHAFDATSTVQSGAFALSALVLAIAIGFIGLRLHPRSYGMVGSAIVLVLASLAMVTVALVSTEETPSPPDGALLIPYALPLAIALLGAGLLGRAPHLFLRGGSKRISSLASAAGAGALVFVAIEVSRLARLLP